MSELLNRCGQCVGGIRTACDETFEFALQIEREVAERKDGLLDFADQVGVDLLDATAVAFRISRGQAEECLGIIGCKLTREQIDQNIMMLKG